MPNITWENQDSSDVSPPTLLSVTWIPPPVPLTWMVMITSSQGSFYPHAPDVGFFTHSQTALVIKPKSTHILPQNSPMVPSHSESKRRLYCDPEGSRQSAPCLTLWPHPSHSPASLGSSSFLQCARYAPASGPLHLIFLLPD